MSDLIVIQCDIKKKQESRDRMLKAAGSMCVLAACIGFVRELLRTGSLHKEYLEALIELTELLSAEIRYERLPIQEALQQIQKWYRNAIFGNRGAGIPERRKGTVSDRRGAGRGMSYRKTSWISGSETAGGAFAGMSGTAAASAEIKAEGTGGKETSGNRKLSQGFRMGA